MSSSGEMKMSLSEMTCAMAYIVNGMPHAGALEGGQSTNILVFEMLEQLQLSVGPLGQDRRAERLHDLLDGDILVCQLVPSRAKSHQIDR
jgi:hypothetical protein